MAVPSGIRPGINERTEMSVHLMTSYPFFFLRVPIRIFVDIEKRPCLTFFLVLFKFSFLKDKNLFLFEIIYILKLFHNELGFY